jgi:hypothetical protein
MLRGARSCGGKVVARERRIREQVVEQPRVRFADERERFRACLGDLSGEEFWRPCEAIQ